MTRISGDNIYYVEQKDGSSDRWFPIAQFIGMSNARRYVRGCRKNLVYRIAVYFNRELQ